LGLLFPLETFPKNFVQIRPLLFSYRGNKQTNRQTNAGDYIIPRESFRGDKNKIDLSAVMKRLMPLPSSSPVADVETRKNEASPTAWVNALSFLRCFDMLVG